MIEKEIEELRHKNKMTELAYERQTAKLKHEWELERGRIGNAESNKRDAARLERRKELLLFQKKHGGRLKLI